MKGVRDFISTFFLGFSILGLVLITTLTTFSPAIIENVPWTRPFIGSVFSIICIIGVLAGVFPSKCSRLFHFKRTNREKFTEEPAGPPNKALLICGHHPDCGHFSAHVFRLRNKVFCAGCIGLILGAIFSLFGTTFYFFLSMSFQLNYFLVFWLGLVCIFCGLFQYRLFNWGKSSIHLFVNTLFVLGVFLLLVAVDALTQNFIIDLYLITLSVFWLFTRILLSQVDHKRICSACHVKDCEF